MNVINRTISSDDIHAILNIDETHFVDLKGKDITPAKLSRTISAFANTAGGEIYVGISEGDNSDRALRKWEGFNNQEEANPVFQVLESIFPMAVGYDCEFLSSSENGGIILHLTIFKSQDITKSTDGSIFVRRNAQNIPIKDQVHIDRLKYDKGIQTFEDEKVNIDAFEIENSSTIIKFLMDAIPTGEPDSWLQKQRLIVDKKPIVAGVLLYSDSPQSILPKRSAVKILRYQTKKEAERDSLVFDPITIEGPLYDLIYSSVENVKNIIEKIEKIGSDGMEKVTYPEEALHEILTNAVLHRDYSVTSDVQVRIFDNRVEIESPGRLPGHVTVQNISKTQFARNPKIVRLINKFKNPPNKDVGEGINTAFEAMEKLRLKRPEIQELDGSVLVILRHESLASPEQLVLAYLEKEDEITNAIARELTGIKSENTMKNVFYRLRDRNLLEQSPKIPGKKSAWRKPQNSAAHETEE